MTRYFSISASDLDTRTYDSIVNDVREGLLEDYQKEGEKLLSREWNDPQPETWQEAFMRDITNDEGDWEEMVEDHAQENAERAVDKSSMELAVELSN